MSQDGAVLERAAKADDLFEEATAVGHGTSDLTSATRKCFAWSCSGVEGATDRRLVAAARLLRHPRIARSASSHLPELRDSLRTVDYGAGLDIPT
jgi:hypothetical protein